MALRTAHWAFAAAGTLAVVALAPRLHLAGAAEAPRASAEAPRGPARMRYAEDAPQLAMLQVEAVERESLPASEPLNARLAYDEDHTARLFPAVAGRVLKAAVQAGDSVRAGQALAVLDAPDYGAARADVDKAVADEARKLRARDRARDLATDQSVASKDLEAAEADYAAAHAESERARARLKNLAPQAAVGGALQVKAPFAGTVTERNASPALEVQPGQALPLFIVSDLSHLWVYIDVPDRYLAQVGPGQRIVLEPDSMPGQRRNAQVTKVARIIDPNTRRLSLRAEVANTDGALLPEMFVRARLLAPDDAQAIRVPASALVTRGVTQFVYVEAAPHQFERRRVHVARRDGADSYVDRGLAPGDRVVTGGALLLDAEFPEPTGDGA